MADIKNFSVPDFCSPFPGDPEVTHRVVWKNDHVLVLEFLSLILAHQAWNPFPSPHSLKKIVVLETWNLCSPVNLKTIYTVCISHQTCFTRKLHSDIDLQCHENNCISLKICSSPRWIDGTNPNNFQTSFHIKIK